MLAIDPSSPFTGGAILGDRVRMQDHATDPGVFIRSMATRGHLGGLALATPEAVRLLDALGWHSDPHRDGRRRPGRGRGRRQGGHHDRRRQPRVGRQRAGQQGRTDGGRRRLRDQQGRPSRRRRDPPRPRPDARPRRAGAAGVRRSSATVATDGTGIAELWDAVGDHRHAATESGLLERRRAARSREELGEIVARRLQQRARELCGEERWRQLTDAVVAGELDPWAAADEMIARPSAQASDRSSATAARRTAADVSHSAAPYVAASGRRFGRMSAAKSDTVLDRGSTAGRRSAPA